MMMAWCKYLNYLTKDEIMFSFAAAFPAFFSDRKVFAYYL